MNNISFTPKAWEEYCYWQMQDKKNIKKNKFITIRYSDEITMKELENQNL